MNIYDEIVERANEVAKSEALNDPRINKVERQLTALIRATIERLEKVESKLTEN